MWEDFKKFIMRGNVVDLAVGVVIGGAFGKIVASLVNDIIMPAIGVIVGGVNFSDLKYVITPANGDIPESAILYGNFIQSVFDFLIIALSIFLFIRLMSSMRKKEIEEEEEEESLIPTNEELLLTEIRDLLKEKQI